MEFDLDAALVASIEALATSGRLQRYKVAAASDLEVATLYLWNIELTGALFPAIAILEVSLRNAIHASLTKKAGSDFWFQKELIPERWRNVEKVINDLNSKHATNVPSGKIISELTFGMWPHIFSDAYKHTWWNPPAPRLAEILPNHPETLPTSAALFQQSP
jgi:hypothetical protein